MNQDDARIRNPCFVDWNRMHGNAQQRFCTQCQKSVFNLSAMSEESARTIVNQGGVCVRYRADPKTGTIHHQAPTRFAVRLATTAVLTAGITLPAAAAISREPGEVGLLATVWEALLDWHTAEDVDETDGMELLPETEASGTEPIEDEHTAPQNTGPWTDIQANELVIESEPYMMGDVY